MCPAVRVNLRTVGGTQTSGSTNAVYIIFMQDKNSSHLEFSGHHVPETCKVTFDHASPHIRLSGN